VASAALALLTAATERRHAIVAFSHEIVPLNVSPRERLDDVLEKVNALPFGGTDCALPMLWALEKGIETDAFIVLTDSETWYGKVHPAQALKEYRRKTGIIAKLAVVGMVSNGFSIADPNDACMLDFVSLSTDTPSLLSQFVGDGGPGDPRGVGEIPQGRKGAST
jgi:60 kDa SS-A/Ro ribonucleoprotein